MYTLKNKDFFKYLILLSNKDLLFNLIKINVPLLIK